MARNRIIATPDGNTSEDYTQQENDIADLELASNDQDIHQMRDTRDMLLVGSDWTQLNDCSEAPERIASYVVYRQKLKDVPQDYPDGQNITWPTKP